MGRQSRAKREFRESVKVATAMTCQWVEVDDGPQKSELRRLQQAYPDGLLVRYGGEFGWLCIPDFSRVLFTVNEAGIPTRRTVAGIGK